MATVKSLLDRKGPKVYSIDPDATVMDATNEMNSHRIGALLVIADGQVVGIFTERDILTRVLGSGRSPDEIMISDVMTSPVAYCTPDTPVEVCKAIFTEKRIRHLPVMQGDKPHGIVTTGDIMAFEADDLQATVKYLEAYIYEGQ